MSISPRHFLPACVAVLLTCALTLTPPAPATGSPHRTTSDQQLSDQQTLRRLDLGRGSNAVITPGPAHRIRVLPKPGNELPGLVLGSGPTGATLQTIGNRERPRTLQPGRKPAVATAEEGMIELRFDAIGRDGRPAPAHISIFDVEEGAIEAARPLPGRAGTCSTAEWADSDCILLPPGTYSVMAFVTTQPAGQPSTVDGLTAQSVALVGDPELELTGPRTVTFDARKAIPVEVSTPGHRTEINAGGAVEFGYTRTAADGTRIRRRLLPSRLLEHTFYLQPTDPIGIGGFGSLTRLRLEAPDITITGGGLDLEPEYYPAVWFSDLASRFPTFDGSETLRVADVGHATEADLAGRDLTGSIAVAERSDLRSVAEQSNAAAAAGAELVIIHNDGPGDNANPGGTGVRLQAPTLRLSRSDGMALKRRGRVLVRGENASPYLYDLVIKESGRIPDDLSYRYRRSNLSVQLRRFHGQPTTGSSYSETAYQYQPGEEYAISTMFPFRDGPRTRVEYRIGDPETRWTYAMSTPELPYNALFPHDPVLPMMISDPQITSYRPREMVTKPIGIAPITAAPAAPIVRAGDHLRVSINAFADAVGNRGRGYSSPSGMSTLLQIRADGELIAETEHLPQGTVRLPSGRSTVEVSFSADNPQSWSELSSHTASRWTFPSATADNGVISQPVLLADWDAPVDLRNRVRTGPNRPVRLGLQLAHQDGSDAAPIRSVGVEASYDGGDHWRPARVRAVADGYRITLPPGRGWVSLRLHAEDEAGSMLDQTTIDAFLRD